MQRECVCLGSRMGCVLGGWISGYSSCDGGTISWRTKTFKFLSNAAELKQRSLLQISSLKEFNEYMGVLFC